MSKDQCPLSCKKSIHEYAICIIRATAFRWKEAKMKCFVFWMSLLLFLFVLRANWWGWDATKCCHNMEIKWLWASESWVIEYLLSWNEQWLTRLWPAASTAFVSRFVWRKEWHLFMHPEWNGTAECFYCLVLLHIVDFGYVCLRSVVNCVHFVHYSVCLFAYANNLYKIHFLFPFETKNHSSKYLKKVAIWRLLLWFCIIPPWL